MKTLHTLLLLLVTACTASAQGPELTLARDKVMLFPYQVVEGSAAKSGLLEDSKGTPISRAKPVLIPKGAKYTVLKTETVTYPAQGSSPAVTLSVTEIKVKSDNFANHDGRPLPMKELQGFVLADRLK